MRSFTWTGNPLNGGQPYYMIETGVFDSPTVDLTKADLSREDGSVALFERMPGRNIPFKVEIHANDQDEADTQLDNLKHMLQYPGSRLGDMAVSFPEGDRIWYGKVTNQVVTRAKEDVSDAAVSFVLETEKPYAESSVGLIDLGATTSISTQSYMIPVENIATYPAMPVISLTVVSTSYGIGSFTIGNPETSQYITVSGVGIQNGTVITIDSVAKRITVGGREVRGYGSYPRWLRGVGALEYYDDIGLSHTMQVVPKYIPRYL